MKGQNIYFASDFHLGADTKKYTSSQREKIIVEWLDEIQADCAVLYLVGDVFDYWFEYNTVIPRGYTRLFGKLAQFTDRGIDVHFFTGNHDMWVFDYFQKELNIKVHYQPKVFNHFGKKVYLAHGDGLGPGDYGYKITKKILANPFLQWMFHRLHPNLGLWLMKKFSSTSRHFDTTPEDIKEMENEWMVIHSREVLTNQEVDYFIYGHRHFPKIHSLNENSQVIYLGDWFTNFTYAKLSSSGIELLRFPN